MNQFISKISSKGQIVVPQLIREKLNIQEGEYIVFILNEDDKIELKRGKIKVEVD